MHLKIYKIMCSKIDIRTAKVEETKGVMGMIQTTFDSFMRYRKAKLLAFLTTTLFVILAMSSLQAAKPGGEGGKSGPSCTISQPQNNPISITTGGSSLFQGVVSGGTAPYDVTWTFEGGDDGLLPAPSGGTDTATETLSSSGDQTRQYDVAFYGAGSFTVTLSATDSNNKRAKNCSTTSTVEVNDGTGNSRPVAQNDEYNTTQNIALVIDAPGVLGNDNDSDGDPMSAVLVVDVSNGTLFLAPDGGFTYTPGNDFTGTDSFTYTANDAGGSSNQATVTIGVAGVDEVSINSTSANGSLPTNQVPERLRVNNINYTLLAINDLGMHCGDLDTRISSILPPFNVLHAQVVERGVGGLPRILGEGEVELFYSAASNPDDPAIGKVAGGQALSSVVGDNVYKTNFWDIASQAYAPFYPPGILDVFYDPDNPAANVDIGLPVPDVERLYLEDGELHASQQAMPGLNSPYALNDPQMFKEHITNLPFFTNPAFKFGYVAEDVNWFEAAGVPIAAFDDFGRENPYPLVRVEAEVGASRVATLDTVMPISGEAECQFCHAAVSDGGNGEAT